MSLTDTIMRYRSKAIYPSNVIWLKDLSRSKRIPANVINYQDLLKEKKRLVVINYLTIIAGHGYNVAKRGFPRSLHRSFFYICEIPDTQGLFQKVCKADGSTSTTLKLPSKNDHQRASCSLERRMQCYCYCCNDKLYYFIRKNWNITLFN